MTVDTGSVFTWIPTEIAHELDLSPRQMWRFRTLDGRAIERPVCDATIEVEGRQGAARIVFADPGDVPVLGVTALDTLGLTVDPGSNTLRPEDVSLAVAIV